MDDLGNKPHLLLNTFDAYYTGIGFFCLQLLKPALEDAVWKHSCVIFLSDPRGVSPCPCSLLWSVTRQHGPQHFFLVPLFTFMPQLALWHCACRCGATCRPQRVPSSWRGFVSPMPSSPQQQLMGPSGYGAPAHGCSDVCSMVEQQTIHKWL